MNAFPHVAAGLVALCLLSGCAGPNRSGVPSDSWQLARADRSIAATQTDVEPIDASVRPEKNQALPVAGPDKEAMNRRSLLFFPVRLPIW
jgi:hypothetical protein